MNWSGLSSLGGIMHAKSRESLKRVKKLLSVSLPITTPKTPSTRASLGSTRASPYMFANRAQIWILLILAPR